MGLINKHSGHAAMQLELPATYEPWVTFVSRVVAFLFADLPGYKVPEDFQRLTDAPSGRPFEMECGNPLCVKLSHIKLPTEEESESPRQRKRKVEERPLFEE